MNTQLPRRQFLTALAGLPVLAFPFPGNATSPHGKPPTPSNPAGPPSGLKTSLNAYSFNEPLLAGKMTIGDMLDFCAEAGFEGVDITGYYFTGYPKPPADDYLFAIKRKALRLGINISGTGVRNDFTIADPAKRTGEVTLVKNWIEVAAKLGAPIIRIFAGNQKNEGIAKEAVTDWMLKDIRTCAEYGKQHGVVVAIQNHNDFIQTAGQIVHIVEAINSEWLGIMLDTGSFRVLDPYEETAASAKYAVNWQVKEKIFINGAEVDTDLPKLLAIIKASGYRGFLPIETLGAGDPKTKITAMLAKLKQAMS